MLIDVYIKQFYLISIRANFLGENISQASQQKAEAKAAYKSSLALYCIHDFLEV